MKSREQLLSLGNVVHPDITASTAIRNVSRQTTLSQELEELNKRRRAGEITRKEFAVLRAPLAAEYKVNLNKGGNKNG